LLCQFQSSGVPFARRSRLPLKITTKDEHMIRTPLLDRRSVILGLGAALVAGPTVANATSHSDDTTKLINDLIQDLTPKGDTSGGGLPIGGPKTRKVVVIQPDGTQVVYWVDYDSSASLSVHFNTDSAKISKRSDRLLRVLATALKSDQLSNYTYMLAGHTDARASRAHNQKLSERRAVSVSNHLQTVHSIAGKRLIPVGFGEDQLLNSKSPASRVNRRVEVGLIVRAPDGAEPEKPKSGETNTLIGD